MAAELIIAIAAPVVAGLFTLWAEAARRRARRELDAMVKRESKAEVARDELVAALNTMVDKSDKRIEKLETEIMSIAREQLETLSDLVRFSEALPLAMSHESRETRVTVKSEASDLKHKLSESERRLVDHIIDIDR